MKFHHKIKAWIVDTAYMMRGRATMMIHKNPPKHYLGYVVDGKVPVVLVPGVLTNWGFMKKLGDKISLLGHPVYIVPELGYYNILDIPSSAAKLKTVVDRIAGSAKKENFKGIVLVAHSKGGLIGKYFLVHHNTTGFVLGLVAVASPFSGSTLTTFLPVKTAKEMHTKSQFIYELADHTEVNPDIISITPEYDNYVWTEKGSRLDGAENIEVPVGGHQAVLFSKEVEDAVLTSIEKFSAR